MRMQSRVSFQRIQVLSEPRVLNHAWPKHPVQRRFRVIFTSCDGASSTRAD
jgi:hypothetical protein